MFAGTLGLSGGAACFAVENQNGDEISPPSSIHRLLVTPTPTETPLIFESPRSLTPTVIPVPSMTEAVTEIPTAAWEESQDSIESPVSTLKPTVVPVPDPVITLVPTPEPTTAPTPEMSMEAWANDLFGLVNQFRAENGVKALNRNALLDQSTKQYSEYLIAENRIFEEHIHDQNGSPLDRANTISNIWFYVGEVEVHFPVYGTTPRMMMDWWIGSTPHRNALLSFPNPNPDERITEFGIGCAWGEYSFPNGMKSMYVVCNGALGILNPTPAPAAIH